jgi:hypothetical protein
MNQVFTGFFRVLLGSAGQVEAEVPQAVPEDVRHHLRA